MQDRTTIGISDLLRQYIEALVKEVIVEGKPFDDHKNSLRHYSITEGIDYETLEKNLLLLFDIADELKTLESNTVEAMLVITARECHLSDKEAVRIIMSLKEQRATAQRSTDSGEATTYEELKSRLIETCREKENAKAQTEATRKECLEAENQLIAERESLEKTLRTADSDATVKVENDLKDLQRRTVASNRGELILKDDLEKASQQEETAQLTYEQNLGLEDKERKKTKIAIVITSIVIVALYVALFLIL